MRRDNGRNKWTYRFSINNIINMRTITVYQDQRTKDVATEYTNKGINNKVESDEIVNNIRMLTIKIQDDVFRIINEGWDWKKECNELLNK